MTKTILLWRRLTSEFNFQVIAVTPIFISKNSKTLSELYVSYNNFVIYIVDLNYVHKYMHKLLNNEKKSNIHLYIKITF